MSRDSEEKFEKIEGKAQEKLAHFFDDPAKVRKARSKAEEQLGKHMDQREANEVVGALESVLRDFAEGDESR